MHNHEPRGYPCPFCRIANGIFDEHVYSSEDDIVYRDQLVTAFIGSHQWPNNPGNTIVIPNEHFENLYDLPGHLAEPLHETLQALARAMKAAYRCQGVSTRQHNEPAGNQDVWHFHIHITPRFSQDNFYETFGRRALMPEEERGEHAARLRQALGSWRRTVDLC